MVDGMDRNGGYTTGDRRGKGFERVQINNATVTMIRGKIKFCEEVGPENALLNVSNDEVKFECAISEGNYFPYVTKAIDFGAVCGTKDCPIWSFCFLGFCWWNDREEGAAVYKPFPLVN